MADSNAPLNFPLLKLVSDARSTYGLRHQDFGRYKSHCVAKVHALRKSAGLIQNANKTRKYQKKDVLPDKVTSDKHLQILLFDSERCWAQSQLLKATLSDPSASPKTKHHFAKRLSKASSRAKDLLELSQSPSLSSRLSAEHVGQSQAYCLVLSGSLAFERGKYEEGLEALSAAYEVLSTLASTSESATDEALANEQLDEVEPMLRFCAYRLGKDTAAGVASISQEVAKEALPKLAPGWTELRTRLEEEGRQTQREAVEIWWRGELVPVRNAELVVAAVKVKAALASLEQDQAVGKKGGDASEGKKKADGKKEILGARRMGTYDKALLTLSDAEAVAHQLVEDNKIALSKGATSRSEAITRPLILFHSYIQYHLLAVRTKRDLLLVSSTLSKLGSREAKIQHAEDTFVARTETRDPSVAEGKVQRLRTKAYPGLVKVYDGVLLSLEAMRDLDVVEQDDELATATEARIAFVRAERCKYLSRAYALASSFPSSLSLNARAKLYSRQARSSADALASLDPQEHEHEHDFIADVLPLFLSSSPDASSSDAPANDVFSNLDRELEADYDEISKRWFEFTGGKVGGDDDEETEGEGLPDVADLSLDGTAAKKDVKEKRKGKKPPFYDVAFNYVTAFDLDAIAVQAGLMDAPEEAMEVEEEVKPVQKEVEAKKGEEEKPATPSKSRWFGLF